MNIAILFFLLLAFLRGANSTPAGISRADMENSNLQNSIIALCKIDRTGIHPEIASFVDAVNEHGIISTMKHDPSYRQVFQKLANSISLSGGLAKFAATEEGIALLSSCTKAIRRVAQILRQLNIKKRENDAKLVSSVAKKAIFSYLLGPFGFFIA